MVTILIDLPSRELVSTVRLANELRGSFDTYIDDQDGYFYDPGKTLAKRSSEDSDFIVIPSYDAVRTKYLRIRAMKSKLPLVLYHTEQIFSPESFGEKLCKKDPFFCDDIAAHLVWGKFMAFAAVARGVDPDKVFIVGNIRLQGPKAINSDVLDGEFCNKNILLPTSFDVADFTDEQWRNFCLEFQYSVNENHHIIANEMRKNWLKFVLSVSKTGANLRVRTHPGEPLDFYQKNLPDTVELIDGTKISLDDDLDWADLAIISNHSTLSYDFYNRNKDFINLEFGSGGSGYPDLGDSITSYCDFNYTDWSLEVEKSKAIVSRKLGYFIQYNDDNVAKRIHSVLKFLKIQKPLPPKYRNYDFSNFSSYYLRLILTNINKLLLIFDINILSNRLSISEAAWIEAGHSIKHFEEKNGVNILRKYSLTSQDNLENFKFTKCGVTKCWLVE